MKTRIVAAGWFYELAKELLEGKDYVAVASVLDLVTERAPEGPDDETTYLLGQPLSAQFDRLKEHLHKNFQLNSSEYKEEAVLTPERAGEYIILSDALLNEYRVNTSNYLESLGVAMRHAALTAPWIMVTEDQEKDWKGFEEHSGLYLYRLLTWRK